MSWLSRFFKAETRALRGEWGPELSSLFGGTSRGRTVNAVTAENLSSVLACVDVIASAIGSLPAYVYRRAENGRVEDPNHPLAQLIQNGPNEQQTWAEFIEWLVASTLLRGNGLAAIEADSAGRIVALTPIPWDRVSVQQLPSGRLAYDVVASVGLYGATGRQRRYLSDEVIHLRDRSDDGLIGRSRLSRAAGTVATAQAINEFSGALYENGANPTGVIKVPSAISTEQKSQLADRVRDMYSGASRAGKVLILDQGLAWESISISPEDAELLASRKFTIEEMARIFRVPPPLIQDYSRNTFTNAATAGRWFAQFTLSPWLRKIETGFSRAMLSADSRATHHIELDMSAFSRGDYEARWQAHKIAVETGVLDVNEIREIEGFNPRATSPAEPN